MVLIVVVVVVVVVVVIVVVSVVVVFVVVVGYRLTRRPVTVVKFHSCDISMLCKAY